MKFRKPSAEKLMGHSEVVDFYDSLPSEFEILGPGEVAVKWPDGYDRARLVGFADYVDEKSNGLPTMYFVGEALRAIAAIAPERKKRKVKVMMTIDYGTHKTGPFECEIEEWR